ncbi:hypothetical protein BegalDRAFT_1832 [Beggiatoa alba B18LD]|uniref:Fibronectin type-III domain-containing protein n=1 Tax=Beggiatoa alba B18LD TaxID=395493 RepID=I3CGG3_9GAMM|nr:hypothetical protein [Beggiatoa alba]EIJ42706.1 hypothetical protein BegalDRAFT_1832 [Beggiatoa alba B18LD]
MQERLKQALPLFFTLGLTAGVQFDALAVELQTDGGTCTVTNTAIGGGTTTAVLTTNLPAGVACTRQYWTFDNTTNCSNATLTFSSFGGFPIPHFFIPNVYKLVCSNVAPAGTNNTDYFTNTNFNAGASTVASANFVGGANPNGIIIFNSVTFTSTTLNSCVLCSTQENQNPSGGAGGAGGDLLVTLSSFNAISLPDSVKLTWKTAFELDNAGFHIWRSDSKDGTYQRLTSALIPADGVGSAYGFTDNTTIVGQRYYYKLEDIDLHGVSTFHEPITAMPNAITILSPADNSTADKTQSPTLAWTTESYTGFKLQYSVDNGQTVYELPATSTFTPPFNDWQTLVEQLPKPTNLIWRVVGQDEVGNQAYSEIQHLTIE